MRTTFIEMLCQLAEQDERIWLLCGDLGYSVLERFAHKFPSRYLNVGVAEQNMIGLASGLALTGKIVFTYSIANFPIMRCLEQIRNDVGYHRLNVKIVAVGGGLVYGSAGYTHYGIEDLAVMRAMPNMTVFAPADPQEASFATRAACAMDGPCYIRLDKAGSPVYPHADTNFQVGQPALVRAGSKITLIGVGAIVGEVLEAAQLLAAQGIHPQVLSMLTVKPVIAEKFRELLQNSELVCVVEEHNRDGGASDVVARLVLGMGKIGFISLALDVPALLRQGPVGGQAYLRSMTGLNAQNIAATVLREIQKLDITL